MGIQINQAFKFVLAERQRQTGAPVIAPVAQVVGDDLAVRQADQHRFGHHHRRGLAMHAEPGHRVLLLPNNAPVRLIQRQHQPIRRAHHHASVTERGAGRERALQFGAPALFPGIEFQRDERAVIQTDHGQRPPDGHPGADRLMKIRFPEFFAITPVIHHLAVTLGRDHALSG